MFNRKERKVRRIKEHQEIILSEAKRYLEMKHDLEANIPLVNDGYTKDQLLSKLSHVNSFIELFESESEKNTKELKQYGQ